MPLSINVNIAAQSALQNLGQTQSDLAITQKRISTGQKVASASDNGATFAIAQNQRSTSRAYTTVMESLNRVQSTVDVASAAAGVVSDLLLQMKDKALASVDASTDTTSRSILNTDFTALRDQVAKAVNNANFNGVNLLKNATNISALADDTGVSKLTVKAQTLNLTATGTGTLKIKTSSTISTATAASTELANLSTSIANVSTALATLGTNSKILAQHRDFIGKLQDAVDAGIGNITDADLSKESAKLQSLQTKQQLGYQALSIANSSTQSLLSLFR